MLASSAQPVLPHETAGMADAWESEWKQVMAERDQLACLQEGLRGPPFTSGDLAGAGLSVAPAPVELVLAGRQRLLHR